MTIHRLMSVLAAEQTDETPAADAAPDDRNDAAAEQ
jgi:hypothetical protein